jgi:hypothetical protein
MQFKFSKADNGLCRQARRTQISFTRPAIFIITFKTIQFENKTTMTVSKASILAVVYGVLLLVLPATTTEALTTKQAVARRRHRKLIKQHIESESTNNHKIHHYHPDRDYRRRMPDYHGKSSKHGKSGSKDYGYGGYGGAAEEGDFYFPGDGDSDTTDESGVAYEDVDAEGGAVDSDFSVPSNSSGMVAPVETEAPDDDTDDGPVFTSSPEGPDADGSVSGGGDSDATEAPGSSPGSGTEDSNNSTVVDGRLETESPTDSPTWMPTEDDSTESPTWFPTDSPSDDVEGRDDLDLDATEAPSTAKSAGQDAVVSTSPPVAQTEAPDVTTNTTGDGSEVIGVDIGNSVTAGTWISVAHIEYLDNGNFFTHVCLIATALQNIVLACLLTRRPTLHGPTPLIFCRICWIPNATKP